MAFTLVVFIQSALLFVNALAILNERRLLIPYGWHNTGANPETVKEKIGSLLHSIRMVLRLPLILVNALFIVFLMVFG